MKETTSRDQAAAVQRTSSCYEKNARYRRGISGDDSCGISACGCSLSEEGLDSCGPLGGWWEGGKVSCSFCLQ